MNSNDSITVAQVKEISATLISAIPQDLSSVAALHWTNSNKLLIKKIRQILYDDGIRDTATVLQEWASLYEKHFKLKKDFSGIRIPEAQAGFNRLVIIAKGISVEQTLKVCWDSFPTNYQTLSEFGDRFNEMIRNDRDPIADYSFWVRDVAESEVEPPAGIKYMPPHPPVPEMTLLERLLFEIKYFSENGEHLDTEKVTCCFGSSHTEGDERPVICWRSGHLQILWKGNHYTDAMMLCSPYWSRSIIV